MNTEGISNPAFLTPVGYIAYSPTFDATKI